jgi:sugar lactone lactonase YvrE
LTHGADHLGEGPVWLPAVERLLRVDITAGAIICRHLPTGLEVRRTLGAPTGFALPAGRRALVAGVGRDVVMLPALDGGAVRIAGVEPDVADNRFNDAAIDPRGRLWAGTMSTTRRAGAGALYRLQPDGRLDRALTGLTISNGLDWNLDATRLYHIDSTEYRVDAVDFDVDRGVLGARRALIRIEPSDGLPDGLTVDAEGGIWIALFGGGVLRRYLPDGRLDAEIRLPVTNPTSMAFAGPELRDLLVTSARHRLTVRQLADEPLAGSLLRLRPGVAGRVMHVFGDA